MFRTAFTLPFVLCLAGLLATSTPASTTAAADPGAAKMVGIADPADAAWRVAVRAGLEHDLHGRHDEADAVWDALERLDWSDPEPWIRRIDTVYWRHFYDEARPLDAERIRTCLDHAQALAEDHLARSPDDLRMRWLQGEALIQEARFEGMRGNYLHAGRVGERGRKQLEAVLEADPEHADARYMLGLYYYYSGLAPEFVRYLSWLWFVPKGDRELGLALLEEVRLGSGIHAANAGMVLFSIHAYHAPTDIEKAAVLARELRAAYPDNAIIHFEMLEVLLKAGQLQELQREAKLLEQRRGESTAVDGRAVMARLWRARAALDAHRLDEATGLAFAVAPDDPDVPGWGVPWVWIVRGQALDLAGEREQAKAAYRHAIESSDEGFVGRRPRRIAQAGLESPFEPGVEIDGPLVGGGR